MNASTLTLNLLPSVYLLTMLKTLLKHIMTHLYKVAGLYFVWILFHFACGHLYSRFCVIPKWYGIFVSPFLAATPHCQAMRWVIFHGGNHMQTMWTTLGIWLATQLAFYAVVKQDSGSD
jgi:hypothetical protein